MSEATSLLQSNATGKAIKFAGAALLVGWLSTIPGASSALEQWRCTVEAFKGFDDNDSAFVQKNLRKQFLLTISETQTLAKAQSKDFDDSEQRFFPVGQDILAKYAVGDITISFDVISTPANPERLIAENGFFNATISTISNSYVNSWLLRCLE